MIAHSVARMMRQSFWAFLVPLQAKDATDAYVKIPMVETHVRSLNLATSVGIGLFEAMRQLDST